MPFLLLLLLTFACLPLRWQSNFSLGGEDLARNGLLSGSAMAFMVAAAAVLARRTRRQILWQPENRETILQRYGGLRMAHLLGLFVVYGLVLSIFGWGWSVQHICSVEGANQMIPGAELLILAPFLATLILSWACFYDVERALHETSHPLTSLRPFWGRWGYVGFHIRHNLAMILPPLVLLIISQGVVRQFPTLENDWRFQLCAYGLLVGVLMVMPWILRLALSLKPLPQGPLRDMLLKTAQRLNFRCNDILLWSTRGGVANALMVGVLPRLRYVVLTDRLITDLTPEEVEAVFGHEVGHVKHHHILYYLGFFLTSVMVVVGIWSVVFQLSQPHLPESWARFLNNDGWDVFPVLPFLGAYIFLVFGFLSRRCERQADIYGCRAVSCDNPHCQGHAEGFVPSAAGRGLCRTGITTFIDALEKVAAVNGISRSRPGWLNSWLHSTIACRVEFLQRIQNDPTIEARFQRAIGRVKWLLLLGLVAILLVLTQLHFWRNGENSEGVSIPGNESHSLALKPQTVAHTAPWE
jgi:Zn-dependent protease with chaperone function